jgi:hypothetical protein
MIKAKDQASRNTKHVVDLPIQFVTEAGDGIVNIQFAFTPSR